MFVKMQKKLENLYKTLNIREQKILKKQLALARSLTFTGSIYFVA